MFLAFNVFPQVQLSPQVSIWVVFPIHISQFCGVCETCGQLHNTKPFLERERVFFSHPVTPEYWEPSVSSVLPCSVNNYKVASLDKIKYFTFLKPETFFLLKKGLVSQRTCSVFQLSEVGCLCPQKFFQLYQFY